MLGSVLSRTMVLKRNVVGCRKFVPYITRLSCLHTYHFNNFSPGRFAESKNFRILPRMMDQHQSGSCSTCRRLYSLFFQSQGANAILLEELYKVDDGML